MNFDEENGSSSSPRGSQNDENTVRVVSNRKRQRSIWFKNSVRVRETISKTDMTEEEKRNYWWHQDGDYYYDQMMRAIRYSNNNHGKNHNQSLKIHRDGSSSNNNYSNLGWVLATTIVVFTLVTTSVYFMGSNGEDDSTIAGAESYEQDLRQFGFYIPVRNT